MADSTQIDITPDKSLVKKLGMVGYRTEQAIAELIDNSIDARMAGVTEEVGIYLDFAKKQITVGDNGHGMNVEQLADAMTIARETKGEGRLGKFGMGMKSACSSLGRRFFIRTSEADSDIEYSAEYDEDTWLHDKQRDWDNFGIAQERTVGERWHGTRITVSELNVPLYPNQVSKFRESFGIRYGPYLQDDQVAIRVNTKYCRPVEFDVVDGVDNPVDIRLEFGNRVTGHISLLKKHSVSGQYGIHLFKRKRLIKAFEKFGFPPHPKNSRVIGWLNLDHVPVNFTKSAFIEESQEYEEAVAEVGKSQALQEALRLSSAVDERIVPIEAVFDYFGGSGPPQYLAKRVSASLSKKMLETAEPFRIMIDKEPVTVSIESLHNGSFYRINGTGNQTRIVINRDSKAFEFVKNPLFLVAMIASEASLLAKNPDLADIIGSRNSAIASFLDVWSQKEPQSRNRGVPVPRIAGYGLGDGLVRLHEFLKETYEFKFQFTSLSTLEPYLHNLLGKVTYTLHTTPGHGRYLTDLLSHEFGGELVVVDRPSRDQMTALLDVRPVRRIVAVREYSVISGSTIAGPEKAFVDLMTDIRTHGMVLARSELRHIMERMRGSNLLNMEKLEKRAKAASRAAELNDLLEMTG